MGELTGISWTHHTFNPWAGCVKVSPACDRCYAEIDTRRRGFVGWGKDAPRRRTSAGYWNQLERWDRSAAAAGERRRVFIGSWCDVMEHNPQLDPIREELWPRLDALAHLDLLLLTKRPQNFRRKLPPAWLQSPRPHVWGMTTVESAKYLWRVDQLRDTPFAIRGLSIEPLLGPLGRINLAGIHWVIVGGESQVGARAMHPDWARELRDQCVDAGIAFHFKQWGEHDDGLVRVGKKSAGRLLDGREWNEFPTPVEAAV
jgi:protein gp37